MKSEPVDVEAVKVAADLLCGSQVTERGLYHAHAAHPLSLTAISTMINIIIVHPLKRMDLEIFGTEVVSQNL